jgi:hypothetical protein
LQQKTTEMISHIRNVTNGQIRIKKMIAYFKINTQNKLIFLYTNSLQLENGLAHSEFPQKIPSEINLKKQTLKTADEIVKNFQCSCCLSQLTKSDLVLMSFKQIYKYLLFNQSGQGFQKAKSNNIP